MYITVKFKFNSEVDGCLRVCGYYAVHVYTVKVVQANRVYRKREKPQYDQYMFSYNIQAVSMELL